MKKKYFCSQCNGLRNHKELFKKEMRGEEGDYLMWIEEYIVIECMGCENISFLKIYGDNTMIDTDGDGRPNYYFDETIFPKYLEESSELKYKNILPSTIRVIYIETVEALKSDSHILAAGGLRAIIEGICNNLKIKKGNLEERINLLYNRGYLTEKESKRLHSIRFLGNDALHEIEKPKKEQLYLLLDIVNHLLSNLYINDKLIAGKVATIIDNWEEFIQLIKNKINKDIINKEVNLDQLLGTSKRLVVKKHLESFEKKLVDDIKDGTYDFISIVKNEDKEKTYKINKVPETIFNW